MEMCLTSTNFTLKKKKVYSSAFCKRFVFCFSFFCVFCFFFSVCFVVVVVVCLFYIQATLKFHVGDYRASTSLGFLEGE